MYQRAFSKCQCGAIRSCCKEDLIEEDRFCESCDTHLKNWLIKERSRFPWYMFWKPRWLYSYYGWTPNSYWVTFPLEKELWRL